MNLKIIKNSLDMANVTCWDTAKHIVEHRQEMTESMANWMVKSLMIIQYQVGIVTDEITKQ